MEVTGTTTRSEVARSMTRGGPAPPAGSPVPESERATDGGAGHTPPELGPPASPCGEIECERSRCETGLLFARGGPLQPACPGYCRACTSAVGIGSVGKITSGGGPTRSKLLRSAVRP